MATTSTPGTKTEWKESSTTTRQSCTIDDTNKKPNHMVPRHIRRRSLCWRSTTGTKDPKDYKQRYRISAAIRTAWEQWLLEPKATDAPRITATIGPNNRRNQLPIQMDIKKATRQIATAILTIALSPLISILFLTALIASALNDEDNSHHPSNY